MPFIDRILAAARSTTAAVLSVAAVATAHAEEPASQSVATLNASELEARGITGLDGIAAAMPGIAFTPALNSISTLSLYMRGEGPVAPGQITLDGAVGVYQDGFYISRLQANTFDLLDLERVEVLAGPQGAQYGRNTAGGVINLISKAPAGELRFDQDVDFGNRNSYRILSSLDIPRWHALSAKVTVLASGIDGYVRNLEADEQDFGVARERAARLQLRWDGLSGVRADYFLERSGLDSTPEYDSNPAENGQQLFGNIPYFADPRGPMHSTYRALALPLSTSNHTAQGLTLSWHPWQALAIESRTGYRTLDANEQQNYAEFFGFPAATVDLYNQHQLSQDLRCSGELFDRQLGYVLGAAYFREKGRHDDDFRLLASQPFLSTLTAKLATISASTRSEAAYARLFWRPGFLGRRVEIVAAGRYTRDSKDATRVIGGADESDAEALNHQSYKRATPEFSLIYHWSEAISTYAKVATAYVAGGALETAPAGDFSSTGFRPESSTTYEVGLQSAFLHDRLHAGAALFDSRRRDVQYAIPAGLLVDQVLDFQRVTVKGASLDVTAAPLRDLTVSASAVYLRPSIDRVAAAAGTILDPAAPNVSPRSPYFVGENVNNLFALPYTPKYSGSLAGDYTVAHLDRSEVLLHLDYVYRARMFTEAAAGPAIPGNQFATQPGYGLLTGRVTYSGETDWSHRLKVSVWGQNLLNRRYYQPAVGVGPGLTSYTTSGSVVTPSGYQSRAGAWAEPRTYGVSVHYEY